MLDINGLPVKEKPQAHQSWPPTCIINLSLSVDTRKQIQKLKQTKTVTNKRTETKTQIHTRVNTVRKQELEEGRRRKKQTESEVENTPEYRANQCISNFSIASQTIYNQLIHTYIITLLK